MKSWFAVLLVLPAFSLANDPAPAHSSEAKPAAKAAPNAHAPIKNAPPTQVDNLKPAKEGKPKTEAVAAGHETAAAPAAHSAAPSEPPVVRYVPPKYSSSTPIVRPVVPSKAPRPHSSSSHAKKTHGSSAKTHSAAVTPGIVRVMPSSSLPAGKVLPAAKVAGAGDANPAVANPASKPRLVWGETTVSPSAGMPAAEIYIVRDPELRWQQYSYP